MSVSPLFIAALLAAAPLVAQDATLPVKGRPETASPADTETTSRDRLPGAAPAPSTEPVPPVAPQLFPSEVTAPPEDSNREQLLGTLPGPAASHAPRIGRTEKSEEDVLAHIRFQRARVAAKTDPNVQSALDDAAAAATEYDRRAALKLYYNRLYDRMAKLDNRFAELLKKARAASNSLLVQTKVRPTEPPIRSATTAAR